jgi:hypothetical protein
VTDEQGRFRVRVRDPGAHQLRADRVGYQRSTSPSLMVMPDDTLRVELRMSTSTVVLAPLTVVASSRTLMRDDQLAEFEWRREHKPFGRFLGPDELRRINPFYASDALRQVPFVQVHQQRWDRTVTLRGRQGGRCLPTVYVDGHYVAVDSEIQLDDWVRGTSLAGVEVYENAVHAPAEFSPRSSNYACGVIVLWTRPPGEPA